jgi:Sulfotransferase domain
VVLSVRPEAAWWTSFSATIGRLIAAPDQVPLPPHIRAMLGVGIELIQVQTFGCPPADREGVVAAYRRRIAEVSAAIPADRLRRRRLDAALPVPGRAGAGGAVSSREFDRAVLEAGAGRTPLSRPAPVRAPIGSSARSRRQRSPAP